MGSTPGGTDLLAAPVDPGSGFRRVAARGSAETRLFLPLVGVTNNQAVFWSMQAVDSSFAGSAFAVEVGMAPDPPLAITPTPPTSAVLGLTPPTPGWFLQERANLATTPWSNPPNGTPKPVNISLTNAAKFYRLAKP